MQVFHQELTFTTSPVKITLTDGSGRTPLRATRLYVEPASTNTHDAFVECAGLATGATGATDGVIKVLAKPPTAGSGTVTDFFEIVDQKGGNAIELSQFQFDGTSGEKVRVTIQVF